MPLSITQIVVNTEFYLTGVLQVASDGSRGTGRKFTNYKVRIVRILNNGAPYPILLGDGYSNQLGWVSADDLTGVRTTLISSVYIA